MKKHEAALLKDAAAGARLAVATPDERVGLIFQELRDRKFPAQVTRFADRELIGAEFRVISEAPPWRKAFMLPETDATASAFAAMLMVWKGNMLELLKAGVVDGALQGAVAFHGETAVVRALRSGPQLH